jgi:hypothetical protein
VFTFDTYNQTTKRHIYRCGIEDWCEEDEAGLCDVGTDLVCGEVGENADGVAEDLDYELSGVEEKGCRW